MNKLELKAVSMKMRTQQQNRFREKYGPWAVVTGASSGIGREIAVRLAAAGLNLVLVARSKEVLAALALELRDTEGIESRVLPVDLSHPDSLAEIIAKTDHLDVGLLVASAGFGTSGSFLKSNLDSELEMLHVNCRAVVSHAWYFGRRFAERKRGGMILLSSIVGFQGMPHAAHYAATKAYVQTLAEALAVELAPSGVDVLAAAPGPTHTGFAKRAGMKMGNALQPRDIAQPILDALGRKTTMLPGFLSKLLVYSLMPLPRWARIRIMGKVMKGMVQGKEN